MSDPILSHFFNIVSRLLPLLERDLNELEAHDPENTKMKQTITDTLTKLVTLTIK